MEIPNNLAELLRTIRGLTRDTIITPATPAELAAWKACSGAIKTGTAYTGDPVHIDTDAFVSALSPVLDDMDPDDRVDVGKKIRDYQPRKRPTGDTRQTPANGATHRSGDIGSKPLTPGEINERNRKFWANGAR